MAGEEDQVNRKYVETVDDLTDLLDTNIDGVVPSVEKYLRELEEMEGEIEDIETG